MQKSFQELFALVSQYCELIEHFDRVPKAEFLQRVRILLPQLYYQMLLLPEFELAGVDEFPRTISTEQWFALFDRLCEFLEPHNSYHIIYDPTILTDDEPERGALADDLADIWRDLKNGLLHWDVATDIQRSGILEDWKTTFHNHWSTHVTDALRMINWLIEDHDVCEPEEETANDEADLSDEADDW